MYHRFFLLGIRPSILTTIILAIGFSVGCSSQKVVQDSDQTLLNDSMQTSTAVNALDKFNRTANTHTNTHNDAATLQTLMSMAEANEASASQTGVANGNQNPLAQKTQNYVDQMLKALERQKTQHEKKQALAKASPFKNSPNDVLKTKRARPARITSMASRPAKSVPQVKWINLKPQHDKLAQQVKQLPLDKLSAKQSFRDKYQATVNSIAATQGTLATNGAASSLTTSAQTLPVATDVSHVVLANKSLTKNRQLATNATGSFSPQAGTVKATSAELLKTLLASIRSDQTNPTIRAMAIAAVTSLDGKQHFLDTDLQALTPQQRQIVRQFHEATLKISVAKGDRKQVEKIRRQLDDVYGQQSMRINTVQLCRAVSGYGVYEPFESETFVAGRKQPMILYVEVDQFKTLEKEGMFRANLSQEVELYTDADGLRVWSLPKEKIIDESRNRRRDFFTVQLINLPARLGVGKYRLKVRITDENGQSFDEWTTPINIIAAPMTASR